MTRRLSIIASLAGLLICAPALADTPMLLLAQTTPAGLKISMESQLTPLTINQMHSWMITLTTTEDQPVTGANIQIDGGMPAHNHGLATQPQVTEYLGDGKYLLQGMRFHMNGEWELQLRIEYNNQQYTAGFQLSL